MKQVVSTERLPIKMWLDDMEEGALEQAKNLANLPFAFKHVAIMPDSHQGYGMPIGAVLATKEVIIPNAVGVDIGCGMCAIKTSLQEIETEQLKEIMSLIRKSVPVGFAHHQHAQSVELMPKSDCREVCKREFNSAIKQIGTLGGGNHFIEIQKGNDGFIWVMIHSGSRNLGKQVADHYNKLAVSINERWRSSVPKEHELAFLPLDTDEAKNYQIEMDYCVEFALANRKLMLDRIVESFNSVVQIKTSDFVNMAHNYADMEHHFGSNVLVHRKGATQAREGQIGLIPGSQGTHSYIVRGKGNSESFQSCSHGAGRRMGRKQAQRDLSLEGEQKRLDAMGVIHSIRNIKDLDEAPSAYKDIDVVMRNQTDLVDIVVKLTPLAVIKG